jgi:hypothetical protein
LVLLYLLLVCGAAGSTSDFSWSPSYFDNDDDDFLPLLLTEQVPLVMPIAASALPLVVAVAGVALFSARATPLLRSKGSRLRAPPLLS